MKKLLLLFIVLASISFTVQANSSIFYENNSELMVLSPEAILANHYGTIESDVIVQFNGMNGSWEIYRYEIISSGATGTLKISGSEFIIEDDLQGI